ncbi:uncharacterized protein [Spinacia oleracea]|uniref:Uncharacterized protein n=1 Tax=Spinacia oleracea TaxID=3562 RepID=A0A9R0KAU7_SPIOL|nr:uncharacterized protein LOC110802891 [Spinacia oleracea]
MNFGVAQNGHVEDGIIHVVSDISEDSLSASSATESYVSAESNSAEAGEGPAIDNAAFLGEESDPQTPENYHHPVRFNEGGHILPQNTSTFPGDPYHSYYPSQQQAFNPRFHMRAPSLCSDSSGSNLSEAGLEGNLGRFQSSIRLTFEAGEPSNVRQQLPMTNQTGLLGSWPRPFVELQQTVNELANMDIYSAGKFGDSDRARMYIPSRGFSDTLARRTTHVQPPPNLNIPGTSTGINDLYGLTRGTSDPSTPVIFKQYSPGVNKDAQDVNQVSTPMLFKASPTAMIVSKKRKQPLTFTRSRSYDSKAHFGYSGSSWSHKRHKSFDDLNNLADVDPVSVKQLSAMLQNDFVRINNRLGELGQKRRFDFNSTSPSKKAKPTLSLSETKAEALPSTKK